MNKSKMVLLGGSVLAFLLSIVSMVLSCVESIGRISFDFLYHTVYIDGGWYSFSISLLTVLSAIFSAVICLGLLIYFAEERNLMNLLLFVTSGLTVVNIVITMFIGPIYYYSSISGQLINVILGVFSFISAGLFAVLLCIKFIKNSPTPIGKLAGLGVIGCLIISIILSLVGGYTYGSAFLSVVLPGLVSIAGNLCRIIGFYSIEE